VCDDDEYDGRKINNFRFEDLYTVFINIANLLNNLQCFHTFKKLMLM
jgi:hypothetical protein